MIYSVITPMGGGKTLFATLYALQYSEMYPQAKIYANYHLKLNQCIFTQFGFLPFSELEQSERALIIMDDFLAIKNQVSGLMQIIANASRKLNLDIILTCQYYTMIPKSIRELSQLVEVWYNKKFDILYVAFKNENSENQWDLFHVENAVKTAKDYYDTKEIVSFASNEEIAKEIIKISKNKDDINKNIEFFTQSEQKRKRMKKLVEELI